MDRPNVLLAFDLSDQRVHKGIVRYANEHEWHLCPYLSSDHFLPHGWSGDGAIMCYGKGMGKFIDSLSMPKVDISAADLPDAIPQVTVDNLGVGQLAADHYLDRGFQHFAYFSWPLVDVNRVRRETFREALVGRGVDPAAIHDICQPAPELLSDWDGHQEAILGQLRGLPRPIGVFTGQDNLGATLIEVCLRSQIDVPEEVAILGADNVEFVCECLSVPPHHPRDRLSRHKGPPYPNRSYLY